MEQVGIAIAIKRYFMTDVSLIKFKKEYAELTQTDKEELAVEFNKSKVLGENIEVVLRK